MTALPFLKMHGLGNDFVVIDLRDRPVSLTLPQRRWIADRRRGIGCDQLILLETPRQKVADVFMRIHNPDGGEAGACGNATRCVAAKVMAEKKSSHVIVETISGLLDTEASDGGRVAVDMGPVKLDWREIPVSEACDTLHLPLSVGPLSDPVGVNVGNPHAVFFVPDAETVDLASLGPVLERHRLFPERANIEVAQILVPGPHPHAGVGAQRRHHPGLRQRRLRDPGRGGAAQADRAQRDRGAGRRRAADRMAAPTITCA